MKKYGEGTRKNPLNPFKISTGFQFETHVHFYSDKGNKCFKPICLNKYVRATHTGKWERGFYIDDFKQTTSPDRITCPECLKKYLPIHIKKNQKYLMKLNRTIQQGE